MIDYNILKIRLKWDLESKIIHSKNTIKEWYEYWDGDVYVSFSGGLDSTALLHLVRSIYPEVQAVFINTRQEFPEILRFVRQTQNVIELKPKITFKEVIEKWGYPIVSKEVSRYIYEIRTTKSEYLKSKRLGTNPNFKNCGKLAKKWMYLIDSDIKISAYCCNVLKKSPIKIFERKTGLKKMMGLKVGDSRARLSAYIYYGGCNAFNASSPSSNPLSFWTEENIKDYIRQFGVSYSSIYDMGYNRTGCMLCLFGCHLQKPLNRIQMLKQTHPKVWNYAMKKLNYQYVCDLIGVKTD